MKRLAFVVMVLCLTAWLPAAAAQAGDLAGTWSLAISDYQNTCGGKPTAAKELSLKQSGRKLTAAIGVTGPDGKNYTGTFQGAMDLDAPPCGAQLKGRFKVAGWSTEETIFIKFPDATSFSGHSKWKTVSPDKKTTCLGTQTIKGRKK